MMKDTARSPAHAPARTAGLPGIAGWVMFDWATQPFYTLITTFLFAPYFANVFIGDPAAGQAIWGYAMALSGLAVALLSPVLGAIADRQGRLKPWIFWFSLVFFAAQGSLWLAEPDPASWQIWLVAGVVVLATIAVEFATTFNNALMPALVPPARLGRLSGIGWATGYAGGLLSLLLMAGFIVSDPATGKSLLGLEPLIANDAGTRIADRATGPFCALWYAVFIVPFFLFTPDMPQRTARPGWGVAIREGVGELRSTLANLGDYKDIALFLAARMLFTDGLTAIFIFGGIYAAAIFGWGSFQLGLFGIALSIAAAAGGYLGGNLDDRFGAKPVILCALILLMTGAAGVLSINAETALFGVVGSGARGGGAFASPGEQLYLAFAVLIGLAAGPLQASSRSLLARMAPPDKVTEFFGLFAFSGKVTSFAAPLAVAAITSLSGSQRIGISVVLLFLAAGFALMLLVRPVYRNRH